MMQQILTYFNPYYDQTIIGFLGQLFVRFFAFLTGQLNFSDLASDEVQILVLVGVAASSAIVGTFLVLRKMSMIANAISHTILVGIVLAFVFTRANFAAAESGHGAINVQVMLIASLLMGILTSVFTEFLTKTVRLQEDASTGLVFTTFFALGIILVTVLTKNAHIGAEVVMGNVDALHIDDCKLVFVIFALNLFLLLLFYKEFAITTFDPALAKALGFSATFFNYLLMIQVSATVVGAFRAVGVLMVLSFITGPALCARMLCHDLKKMIFFALAIGCLASVLGVALARHILSVYGIAFSTAGIVVCMIIIMYALVLIFAKESGLFSQWLYRQKLKKKI